MEIKLDFEELAKLADNRDVTPKKIVLEFVDEFLMQNPKVLWEVEEGIRKQDLFRCWVCGFWIDSEEKAPHSENHCVSCAEEEEV